MKTIRGYNFSRPFLGERVPQHVQNIVIKEFCNKEKLNYLLSVTEYSMKNSSYILNQLMNELKYLDGIVAYSVFQMPYEDLKRTKISNKIEMERIEKIWLVRKALNKSITIEDYKIN